MYIKCPCRPGGREGGRERGREGGKEGEIHLVVGVVDEGPHDRLPLILCLLHFEHETVELLL